MREQQQMWSINVGQHQCARKAVCLWKLVMLGVIAWCAASVAAAQTAPDAGRLLQQQQQATEPREPGTAESTSAIQQQAQPAESAPASATQVKVTSFRVEDDAGGLFAEDTLLDVLKDYAGKSLSMTELQRAADAITAHYRDHGYFLARAYLPQQDVSSGVVSIRIAVGRIETGERGAQVLIRPDNLRLREQAVRDTLTRNIVSDAPLKITDLERGVLLLNDLPGINARANLAAGDAPGTVRLEMDVSEGSWLSGTAGADNYGYRQTGNTRGSAALNINDPLSIGDQISLSGAGSGEGMVYGQFAYQLPIGHSGFKTGVAYSHLNYELGKELASLEAKGKADNASLFASYPIIRSRTHNLSVKLSIDYKKLFNEAAGVTTSDKYAETATLYLNDDLWDNLWGGGVTSFGLSATYGRLHLDDLPLDLLIDDLTARTQGNYTKVNLTLARQQRLDDRFSLYVSASAQSASKNLDSSEKLTLGGAFGVRAYPYGEGSGDEGYTAGAELRWDAPVAVAGIRTRVFGFYDAGRIRVHKKLWFTGSAPNTYNLQGAGLGVVVAKSPVFSVRATWARKIGSNPNPTSSGTDSDGTNDKSRFWLQASVSF